MHLLLMINYQVFLFCEICVFNTYEALYLIHILCTLSRCRICSMYLTDEHLITWNGRFKKKLLMHEEKALF